MPPAWRRQAGDLSQQAGGGYGFGSDIGELTTGATTAGSRASDRVRERLGSIQADVKRVRAEQRELEQQVAFLIGVADDAETRRLVAETPLAEREWRAARSDLEAHQRLLHEARDHVEALERERDRLLDRLLDLKGMR